MCILHIFKLFCGIFEGIVLNDTLFFENYVHPARKLIVHCSVNPVKLWRAEKHCNFKGICEQDVRNFQKTVYHLILYSQGSKTFFNSKWRGKDVKNGDRILLSFDFVESQCSVSFNDHYVGVLSERLPSSLYIVVNPDKPTMSIEVTKYEIVPKV